MRKTPLSLPLQLAAVAAGTLVLIGAVVGLSRWQPSLPVSSGDRLETGDHFQFLQRRLALLESENERLRRLVAENEKTRAQADDLARRTEIERQVAAIRGLSFREPVNYNVLTRAELKGVIETKLAEQWSDEEIRRAALGLSALGLLPPEYPLKEKYVELLGEQVAAFYDQHRHKLFMFEDATLANVQNRIILAHELVHALQDQHFGLKKLPLEIKTNDDRAFAASALVEGDATLVMTQFMLAHASFDGLRDTLAGALGQSMKKIQAAPRYLREMLVFPYLFGQEFCATLYERGGYPAVSAAYERPPSSSAQILHPEKYLAEPREEPVAIDFGDTAVSGRKPAADNVLGEIGIRILLAEWLAQEPRAKAAADGWRGDRYLVYAGTGAGAGAGARAAASAAGEDGSETASAAEGASGSFALIWRSEWASEAERDEFAGALRDCLLRRYKASGLWLAEMQPGVWAGSGPARWLRVLQPPGTNEVVLIDATTEESGRPLLEKIPKGTTHPIR